MRTYHRHEERNIPHSMAPPLRGAGQSQSAKAEMLMESFGRTTDRLVWTKRPQLRPLHCQLLCPRALRHTKQFLRDRERIVTSMAIHHLPALRRLIPPPLGRCRLRVRGRSLAAKWPHLPRVKRPSMPLPALELRDCPQQATESSRLDLGRSTQHSPHAQ